MMASRSVLIAAVAAVVVVTAPFASGFAVTTGGHDNDGRRPRRRMTVMTTRTLAADRSANGALFAMSDYDGEDDSSPSDSSMDDSTVMTVESESFVPSEAEAVVTSVMDQLPSHVGTEISFTTRAAINESLLKLERLYPTENPTMSPLLNGVWEMRYAAGYSSDWALSSPTREFALFLYSGGYSPGLFALSLAQNLPPRLVSVGDLTISISREQPRIEASVDLTFFGGTSNTVTVRSRLDVESEARFRETYESATVLGRSVDIPSPAQYSRELYVTYVDEDLLVVRDASGVPEVLVRKSKTFSQNWGTEPGELEDDMTAPGETMD